MKVIWKIFSTYILVILLMLVCNSSFGQRICKKNVCVVEFNASWNEGNSVAWLDSLENCGIVRVWIDKGDWKEKYNITVVPTIIVFSEFYYWDKMCEYMRHGMCRRLPG